MAVWALLFLSWHHPCRFKSNKEYGQQITETGDSMRQ